MSAMRDRAPSVADRKNILIDEMRKENVGKIATYDPYIQQGASVVILDENFLGFFELSFSGRCEVGNFSWRGGVAAWADIVCNGKVIAKKVPMTSLRKYSEFKSKFIEKGGDLLTIN